MSEIWFTADCHFDHANIIKLSKRPFKNIKHMNEEIIKRWNSVVKPEDIVYHVGDFAFKGLKNCQSFENRLNGKIIHIEGNHDRNNGVKSYCRKALLYFGGKDVFVQHHPPEYKIMSDFCICGHIHGRWKYKIHKKTKYIVINVGVDVWNFTPVSTNSILKLYSKIKFKAKKEYGEFK